MKVIYNTIHKNITINFQTFVIGKISNKMFKERCLKTN